MGGQAGTEKDPERIASCPRSEVFEVQAAPGCEKGAVYWLSGLIALLPIHCIGNIKNPEP